MKQKNLITLVSALAVSFLISIPAFAQTYNSSTGGYNTGYGHMYGSFGMAMATQNMYNTMQMNMQRAMARSAMIKRWGKAAVEKAEREAAASSGRKSSSSSSTASSTSGAITVPPPVVPKYYGKFRPDATVNTGKLLSEALGETAEEKALLSRLYTTVKAAYDKEAASKGWTNNIAGALTFFLVSNTTVYHNAPDPSDETVAALYDAVNQTIDEIPEFGKMPNKDKQAFHNMLIGFAAIPLMTYMEGKQNGDDATLNIAHQLAGQQIELILKTSPDKLRFDNLGK